jgi:hypothetical protein
VTVVAQRTHVVLAIFAPIAAIAILHGTLAAGLVPLAALAPTYALARTLTTPQANVRALTAGLLVAATIGIGLAMLPAFAWALDGQPAPGFGLGLQLAAAGTGTLAGIAAARDDATPQPSHRGSWTMVRLLEPSHARGLVALLAVGMAAGALVVGLRELPLVPGANGARSLAASLFGDNLVAGNLVLPDAHSKVALAIPLTLAPLALGTLTSIRRSGPMLVGGAAALGLGVLVRYLDVPVEDPAGNLVPIDVLANPGLASLRALAPAGAGILVGASLVFLARQATWHQPAQCVAWTLGAAIVTLAGAGPVPAIALATGLLVASLTCAYATQSAPLGAAIAAAGLLGWLASTLVPTGTALAFGATVAVTAIAAAAASSTLNSLPLDLDDVRTASTLTYTLTALAGAGLVAAVLTPLVTQASAPLPAPHALATATGLEALVEGQSLLLLAWGVVAGLVLEFAIGQAAWAAIGVLAGPGVALAVFLGSIARSLFERTLLDSAREGFVTRGELGYALLRLHVTVLGLLAGEALATATLALSV